MEVGVYPVKEGLEPFANEQEAMKKYEDKQTEENRKALAAIRFAHAESFYQLFKAKNDSNALELALLYAASAAELDPDNSIFRILLGMIYSEMTDYLLADEMALEAFEKAVDCNPGDVAARLLLGKALAEQEEYVEAIDQLEKAIEMNPEAVKPGIIGILNTCYIMAPLTRRGFIFYIKILEERPDLDYLRLSMSILLKQHHAREEAEKELQAVIGRPGSSEQDRQYARELMERWDEEEP